MRVAEFCERMRISRRYYEVLRAQGLGPKTTKLDRRLDISEESATAWLDRHRAEESAA